MSIFLIIVFSLIFLKLSKKMYLHWLNPLSIYTLIWMPMLVLFEMKLMAFYSLSTFTWIVIIGAYISFFLGALTIYLWNNRFNKFSEKAELIPKIDIVFSNNGKIIRNSIIIFSLIGLFGALQHWYILINEFGSIAGVLLNAIKVYNMRQANEIKGVIPYLWLFSFFAIFLSGTYMAYKGKISIIALLPILGVVLKDMAKVARNGILLGLFEFFFSYIFFSYFLSRNKFRRIKKKNIVIGVVVILALMISSVAIIKLFRQSNEKYIKTNSELVQFKDNLFISPQIYFYAASQVGVLNKFLEKDNEHLPFGSKSFSSIYNIASTVKLIDKIDIRPKGYLIPEWSNTATYLRDLYSDFGIIGPFVVPFLLGIFSTLFWFKFMFTGKIKYLLLLTHLSMIIAMSFFVFVMSMTPVTYGIIFIYPMLAIIEKYYENKEKRVTPYLKNNSNGNF